MVINAVRLLEMYNGRTLRCFRDRADFLEAATVTPCTEGGPHAQPGSGVHLAAQRKWDMLTGPCHLYNTFSLLFGKKKSDVRKSSLLY